MRMGYADKWDGQPMTADEQLRLNVVELMRIWHLKQWELAERMGIPQPLLSRKLSGPDHKGGLRLMPEIDTLSGVFGLSPSELLQPGYGRLDRRRGVERRQIQDRRRSQRSEVAAERDRLIPRRRDNRIHWNHEP